MRWAANHASLAAATLAAAAAAAAPPSWLPEDFRDWAVEHQKQYGTDENWQRALDTYLFNAAVIEDLNADEEDGAEYGHTAFSDLSGTEFKRQYFPGAMDAEVGRRGAHGGELPPLEAAGWPAAPAAVDWRQQGAVTPVKNQASCGSCWAEAAVGNIESAWFLANKATMQAPVALSVEEVIECDDHDYACYGGYPKGAYEYVIEKGGIASEADYPYNISGRTICLANQTFNETCGDGMCGDPPLTSSCDVTCSDRAHTPVAKITSWVALPKDEGAIAAYVAQHGPIAVGIDAAGGGLGVLFPWLQHYKRGVANPKRCTTTIDHGVLMVGFGEEDGQPYWVLKNSWGAAWGESGYFRMLRGASKCGVATMATAAVLGGHATTTTEAAKDLLLVV